MNEIVKTMVSIEKRPDCVLLKVEPVGEPALEIPISPEHAIALGRHLWFDALSTRLPTEGGAAAAAVEAMHRMSYAATRLAIAAGSLPNAFLAIEDKPGELVPMLDGIATAIETLRMGVVGELPPAASDVH